MNSFLNLLSFTNNFSLNILTIVPIIIFVALGFLLKIGVRKQDSKRPQNIKNQTKISSPKQKQNKPNNEKGNKKKETSISSSVVNDSTNVKTVVSKYDKQIIVNEKSPKKNVQNNKKQQVTDKHVKNSKNIVLKNQKTVKSHAEDFISKEEEGEWQMVTTKKQKQNKNKEVPSNMVLPTKPIKKNSEKPAKKQSNREVESSDATTIKSIVFEDNDKHLCEIENNVSIINAIEAQAESRDTNVVEIPQQLDIKENHTTEVSTTHNENSQLYNYKVNTNSEKEKDTSNHNLHSNNVAFDELGGKYKKCPFSMYVCVSSVKNLDLFKCLLT